MKRNLLISIVVFSLIMITAGAAQTETAEGAQATAESGNQTANTDARENVTVKAGAVANVTVDQSSLTDKWAGFYGSIEASRVLGSSSGNLYTWTASTLSDSKVLAAPLSASPPTNLQGVGNPNNFLDNFYGPDEFSTGVANASGTFETNETIDILGQTGLETRTVDTYGDSGSSNSQFTTFLFDNGAEGSDSPVFVAEGNDDVTGFEGETLNYQMLVGVGETADQQGYSFYLALP